MAKLRETDLDEIDDGDDVEPQSDSPLLLSQGSPKKSGNGTVSYADTPVSLDYETALEMVTSYDYFFFVIPSHVLVMTE